MHRYLLACAFSSATFACGSQLPPRTPPPQVVPRVAGVPAQPPAQGQTRLLLDAIDGPARVYRVTGQNVGTSTTVNGGWNGWSSGFSPVGTATFGVMAMTTTEEESLVPLCMTPCALDTTPGYYRLKFVSVSDPLHNSHADIGLQAGQTTAVRHAIGFHRPMRPLLYGGGSVALLLGIGLSLFGGILLPAALSLGDTTSTGGPSNRDALIAAGAGMLAGGIGLDVLGGWLLVIGQPVDQSGATTSWPVP